MPSETNLDDYLDSNKSTLDISASNFNLEDDAFIEQLRGYLIDNPNIKNLDISNLKMNNNAILKLASVENLNKISAMNCGLNKQNLDILIMAFLNNQHLIVPGVVLVASLLILVLITVPQFFRLFETFKNIEDLEQLHDQPLKTKQTYLSLLLPLIL